MAASIQHWCFSCFITMVSSFIILSDAIAIDSTEVLPQNVRSPSLRMGWIEGLGSRYNSSGNLQNLNDYHSKEFNVTTLSSIEPDVQNLVKAINDLNGLKHGDQLTLGFLRVESNPSIQYIAPIHAWGINSQWTLGFGFPVIRYQNQIKLAQQGSNLDQFKEQYGGMSENLDSAFRRLDVSLPQAVESELAKKGYRSLSQRDETIWGDLDLVSMYQFLRTDRITMTHKGSFTLPTGKRGAPNDLLALHLFGETAIENNLLIASHFGSATTLGGKLGLRLPVPDRVKKRVPKNSTDVLPGPESEDNTYRQLGSTLVLGANVSQILNKSWTISAGFEHKEKQKDRYRGDFADRNYDLLSEKTDQKTNRTKWAVAYSSVKDYLAQEARIPTVLTLEYSDVFSGVNVPRQTITELQLMLFY